MNKKFVPDDFVVPEKLETDKFRLRMLTVDDAEKDYEAVMSSLEHLRNPLDENSWPRKDMSLEENLKDLQIHQDEFLKRVAFTYTVVSLDESKCLGCVYIDPSKSEIFDAEVHLWARSSELKNGLDELLYETVKNWMKEKWMFNNIAYPGREISWSEWGKLEGKMRYTVNIVLFEQFETLDVFGPVEVFGGLPDIFKLDFISIDGKTVSSTQNVRVETNIYEKKNDENTIILIPGGMGTRKKINDKELINFIKNIAAESKYILSVCTGSALLAKTGLLDGKKATTNKRAFDWVVKQGKDVLWVRQSRWVNDGNIFTSSGVSA